MKAEAAASERQSKTGGMESSSAGARDNLAAETAEEREATLEGLRAAQQERLAAEAAC